MKPIKLKIKGINSFIEEQPVDFEELTDRGLFGIFGPTGSGKSTVLDGITLALYGEVARKSDNFINTNCTTASVSFEFQISGKEIKRYLVTRDFKSYETGKPRSNGAKLLELTGGDPIVLADKKIQVDNKIKEIIGLDCVDFTRTVVLPQGKFSEFLSLDGKPRREMLERLFNLQEYGDVLSIKLSKKMAGEKEKLSILQGKLSGYEDITEDRLKEENDKKEALINDIKVLNLEKVELDKSYEDGEKLYNLLKEYNEYKKEESILENRKEEIVDIQKRVEKGEGALKVNPYLKAFLETTEELKASIEQREKNKLALENVKKEKEETDKSILKLKEERDKKIPELRIKEQSIKEGIVQKEELVRVYEELQVEKKSILELKDIVNEKQVNKNALTNSIGILKEEIVRVEETIDSLKVEDELKELVQQGLLQEEKYILAKNQYTKISGNLVECKNVLEKDLKDLKVLEEEYNKVKQKLDLCTNKLKEEEEKNPGSDSDLINLNQTINELEKNWSEFNKLTEEKNKVEKELEIDENKATNLKSKIELLDVEVNDLKEKVKSEREKNIANALRESLKSGEECPVCGSREHFIENINLVTNEEVLSLEEILTTKEKDLNEAKIEISKLEERVSISKERKEKILESLNLLGEDFKVFEVGTLKEKFKNLKESMDIHAKVLKELSREKDILTQNNLNISSELKSKEGRTQEGEKNLKVLEKDVESVKITLKSEEDILKDLNNKSGVLDFKLKWRELQEKEKKVEVLQKEIKNKRNKVDEDEKIEKKMDSDLNQLKEEGSVRKQVLQEKIKNFNEKKEALETKFGKENLEEVLKATILEIERVESIYATLEEKKKKVDNEYQIISDLFITLVTKQEELTKRSAKEEENLNKAIEDEGFLSKEDVISCLISKESLEDLKKKITDYKESLSKVKGTVESLLKKIDGKEISEEEFIILKEEKNKKQAEIVEKEKEKARVEEAIERINKKLEEFSDLIKEREELDKNLALLKDLDGLLKGKKFVEYMATAQLKYISLEASKKLKDITGGIYGLEVDADGKFLIRDYKNGGAERDASTLSGGETFLASLCLALALSSQIQLKGTAPLELFFLDEGFGTLDENLLEVVMSSLEKIHNDKLKVGIISHVESIKNRIPVKLMVSPAETGRGGSKVKIERS